MTMLHAMPFRYWRRLAVHHKNSVLLPAMTSWILLAGCEAAPITISQSHVEAVFSAGSIVQVFIDSTGQPVNVGNTGGPNVYDFRNRPFYLEGTDTVFSVTEIPQLAPRFPSNALTLKEPGEVIEYPVFSFSNQRFYSEGRGRISSATTESYQHNIPAEEFLRFPVEFNTQFSVVNIMRVDTTYDNGIPTNTSSETLSNTKYVDGYGTLLLPGELAFECLRLRIVGSSTKPSKAFEYWTREGAIVLVNSDGSQPDTGVVQTGYIIYLSPVRRPTSR